MTALRRELGLAGAVLMGLGSIVGTGIFVSVGTAAGVAGPMVVIATVIAAIVAACNGLSSAQLAASHPVSGGTYEYGYRYLTPSLGFAAGWLFLLAKSASAATAALGFAGYLSALAGLPPEYRVPIALGAAVLMTVLVLGGIKRSNAVNAVIVSIALLSLLAFMLAGADRIELDHLTPFVSMERTGDLLHATALMFVAYTGYGRIATLGEEVKDPARTIPRAIVTTLLVSMLLYAGVAFVGVGSIGAVALAEGAAAAAPLELAAKEWGVPFLPVFLAIGATCAMLGVLLNLILGLSRVLLAMGRRGDMPSFFSRTSASVIGVSAMILALVSIGSVKTSWSFSAFTVLVYYAITNLAALRLPKEERRFPRAFAIAGLFACAFLAFWVEGRVLVFGVLLVGAGLLLRLGIRHFGGARDPDEAR